MSVIKKQKSDGTWEFVTTTGNAGIQGIKGDQGTPGLDGSPDTASVILTKLLTVDGEGSGLDADKLDGKEASDFTPITHSADTSIHRKITISNVAPVLANMVEGEIYLKY